MTFLYCVEVEESYDGMKLGTEMTREFIDDMVQRFKNNKRIHKKYVNSYENEFNRFQVYRILFEIKSLLMEEPTMVEITITKPNTLTICGDTHGTLRHLSKPFCSLHCRSIL